MNICLSMNQVGLRIPTSSLPNDGYGNTTCHEWTLIIAKTLTSRFFNIQKLAVFSCFFMLT